MTKKNLKIGILGGNQSWVNRLSWLLGQEFGCPLEVVTDNFESYPILVVSDSAISKNKSLLSKHLENGFSLLITHDSESQRTLETPKSLPIIFGEIKNVCGKVTVTRAYHPSAKFFLHYLLNLGKSSLCTRLREIESRDENQIAVYLSENDLIYPLLICGFLERSSYAVIALGDEDIETSKCAPLMYLAALHYLLSDKPFVRKSFWRNEKRVAVVLTFDFEGLAKYTHIKKYWWWNRHFDEILLRLGIRPILKFLREKRIPSTWFMLGSQVSNNPRLARKLAGEKLIEVAGHGDVHRGIDKFGQRFDAENREIQSQRIAYMKKIIHDILLIDIKGFRAPRLNANIDTIRALIENGFEWDSSASPQSNLPFREFPWPFNYVLNWEREEIEHLIEIPVQAPWDIWCPLHGCFHSTEEYEKEIKQGFEAIRFIGGVQVLLIHPKVVKNPGYWKAAESHVKKLLKMDDVNIMTCGEIAQDWNLRNRADLQASFDENKNLIYVKIENGYPGLTLFTHIPKKLRVKEILDRNMTRVIYKCWPDLDGIVFSAKSDSEEFTIHLEPRGL